MPDGRPLDTAHARRIKVVPREHRPMVSVEFAVSEPQTPFEGKYDYRPRMVEIKLRSNRAYHVVTDEDVRWMKQVTDEFLSLVPVPTPTPPRRRSRRSSPAEPTTSASAAASSTSTAAAPARRPRRTQAS